MEVINFAEKNSVINRFMAELRDVNIQTDRIRFRRNLERIGEIMAYEISHRLHYSEKKVKTPLGTAHVNLPDDTVVLATILRAGLPFHQGFLSCLDDAQASTTSCIPSKISFHSRSCVSTEIDSAFVNRPLEA